MTMKLFKEAEVSEQTGLSTSMLRKMRGNGTGPAWAKLMGAVRYPSDELDRWIEDHMRRAA